MHHRNHFAIPLLLVLALAAGQVDAKVLAVPCSRVCQRLPPVS
jgi:hypothetical protein